MRRVSGWHEIILNTGLTFLLTHILCLHILNQKIVDFNAKMHV